MSTYQSIHGDPDQAVYYVKEPKKPEYKFTAQCTSLKCAFPDAKIEKNVPRRIDVCPDCGHFLVWKRDRIG